MTQTQAYKSLSYSICAGYLEHPFSYRDFSLLLATPFFGNKHGCSSRYNEQMYYWIFRIPGQGSKQGSNGALATFILVLRQTLVMEVFLVFGQIERKHTRKDERIILAWSNIDAICLRQAEPLL